MAGTLKDYKIKKDINIFQEVETPKVVKEEDRAVATTGKKQAGRPKKAETCNKKVILYFTENEYKKIGEKCESIAMSPFLKKVVLDYLK